MKLYYVYVLASISGVLYIGMTGNLEQRLIAHRWSTDLRRFTTRYRVWKLVYTEEYTEVVQAIERETQLKGWRREKKLALIRAVNPGLTDLAPYLYPGRVARPG